MECLGRLKIGVLEVPVYCDPSLREEQCHGVYETRTGVPMIRVASYNPSSAFDRSTLLHEVLHAVFSLYGLGDLVGGKREEAIVRTLEMVLVPLIRDNPFLEGLLCPRRE